MSAPKNSALIASGLLLTVTLWGANNTGTKWLVAAWPPVWTGAVRFLLAGGILLAVLRCTKFLGEFKPIERGLWPQLWLRGGLSVALYLGASPIWALLAEERPRWSLASLRRYAAALLALSGVVVLCWPALQTGELHWLGELSGLTASLMWANYCWQSRVLSQKIPGVEVAAHSMWMSGVWLLPLALFEISRQSVPLDAPHLAVQTFCIIFGGVIPYAIWNSALRHWRTSQVMLFNNFIPLTTALWCHFLLGEPITSTFCLAMVLVVVGVLISQVDWAKVFRQPEGI